MSLEEYIRDLVEEPSGDDVRPRRIYTLYQDYPPAPAMYAEVALDDGPADDGESAPEDGEPGEDFEPVLVHNFRYYEWAMDQWEVNVIELLVLNELHELTHWAMTDTEREYFDTKARAFNRPDGYWLNVPLFRIVDWLPRDHPDVIESPPPPHRRLLDWLSDRLLG